MLFTQQSLYLIVVGYLAVGTRPLSRIQSGHQAIETPPIPTDPSSVVDDGCPTGPEFLL
jgi:hypothetical protein